MLYTDLTATFTSTNTSLNQSFLLCGNESTTIGNTGVLGLVVNGTNANDYLLLNGENMTFTIAAAPQPTITLTPATVFTAGSGIFRVSSNIEGKYYCSVREGVFTDDSNTLSFYKGLVANNSTTIQSSSDFLTHLYPRSRDWTVVSADLTPIKTSNLTVTNKRPETNYSFCCYYSNTAGTTTTGPSCNAYLTPADSSWQRHSAIFTFSNALNATQRNNLLRSLNTAIRGATTSQIVNRRGESYNSASPVPKT